MIYGPNWALKSKGGAVNEDHRLKLGLSQQTKL